MEYFKAERKVPIPTKDMLSWIFDEQKYDQDKPIYYDAADLSRSISSRQARTVIRQLVAGLQAAGVKQGDCVCVHSFNDIYYSMLYLGIIGAGAIFTGTNPAYTPHELAHHFRTSETKFLITEPEMLDNIVVAAKECNIPQERIFIFNVMGQAVPSGFKSWQTLLQQGEKDWVRFDSKKEATSTTAARMFSSGTTGLPKAATLTHYNFIAQHTMVFDINEELKKFDIRRLHVLPMFHMAAVPGIHIAPLRSAHVSYVMKRFELEPFLANLEKFRITELFVVPPLVIAIIMSPLCEKYSLKSVKQSSCGAAPLEKGTQDKFRALLAPDAKLTQVWGMTESCCVATMFPANEDDDTASVGRLLPNMEAILLDDEGKNISGYDVRGEIALRGPCTTPGYFRNPSANAASFSPAADGGDPWFHTGDVVYCSSATRKWYIVDRKKELIKVRGFQVAPLEIEGILLAHPGVVDVAVIGVKLSSNPDQASDELPRAYIVRRPGVGDTLTEDEIKSCVAQRLAKYKWLEGGVRFVDAIPKNATGKIMKKALRDQAQKEIERENMTPRPKL